MFRKHLDPRDHRGNKERNLKQGHFAQNWTDRNGNPAGGVSSGRGFTISWQNGPLGRGEDRDEPNGAFVEDVIDAVIKRIEFYQNCDLGKFACEENAEALKALKQAARQLELRTKRRESEGVEGTHRGN